MQLCTPDYIYIAKKCSTGASITTPEFASSVDHTDNQGTYVIYVKYVAVTLAL